LYESLAEKWLDPVIKGSEEWMCACPFCKGDSNLQFNISNGLWLCFRCKEKGTARSLVTKLGGSYTNPAVGIDQVRDLLDKVKSSLQEKNEYTEPEWLPESYLARFGGRPHEHWIGRGPGQRNFTSDTVREWGLGYDPLGPRLGRARVGPGVTIPYRDLDGNLLGVIFRRLGDGFPRYLYPKGFDRTASLFGSWKLGEDDNDSSRRGITVGLVEGSTDALRIRQLGLPALAQYGSSLHVNQVRLLRRLNVKEVVLFYDYDVAGRHATEQAAEILNGFSIRTVKWDEERYCWHKRLCGCDDNHHPMDIAHCPKFKRKRCRCGRIHDVDPGNWRDLPDDEVHRMWDEAVLLGRPKRLIVKRRRK
jgi:5S rRNA maturation endonuclease (ribonuclease M5)